MIDFTEVGKIRGDFIEITLSGHTDGERNGWNSIGITLGDNGETITVQEARELIDLLNVSIQRLEEDKHGPR